MSQNTTTGTTVMELFLRVLVYALMAILIAIPVCMLGEYFGIFDALGIKF